MVLSGRRVAGVASAGLICIALAIFLAPSFNGGQDSSAAGVPAPPWSLADDLLAVPGVQSLDGGQQLTDQIQAQRLNPAAVFARERSRTAFAHLGDAGAARVVREQLPSVLAAAPTGLAPGLEGGRIERYLSNDSARLALPGGKHAMVVSTGPIATKGGSGAYRSLDLSLHEARGGFVPADSAVVVRIPKTLTAGAEMPASGVSLTPVAASGTPLPGSGSLDGSAVLYANTQTDTDTVIKATPSGFETDTVLRSVDSPEELSFHVGLPAGAVLEPSTGGSGATRVVSGGKTISVIPTPTAQDAEGAEVPVTTSVSDGDIHLVVVHRGRDYRYPITVDPTVIDSALEQEYGANWRGSSLEKLIRGVPEEGFKFEVLVQPLYQVNESGYVLYPTQGESHIYAVNMETSGSVPANVENHLAIMGAGEGGTGAWEASVPLAKSYGRTLVGVCVIAGCSSSAGSAGNVAAYWVNATGAYAGETGADVLYAASVYIAQNNGPSASFDTSHEYLSGAKKNVLYGGGSWIREGAGAAEVDTSDPGVGVSKGVYTVTGGAKWTGKYLCAGPVQCPEVAGQQITLKNANSEGSTVTLPDGEPTVEAQFFDAMGSASAVVSAKLKVDGTAPSVQTVSGLPESGEVGDAYHALNLTAKATDGSGSTPSSGVASLKLAVDGHPIGSPNGSCSPGPCTATGEWTINAEEFGAGKHVFTVIATDGAGNVGQSAETPFTVHHATPTAFGPGTINPVTGDFDMEESDVSISTSGPSLNVTRNYDSRNPTAGAEGPLGAPWSLSIGDAQQLTRNPSTKSVILTSPSGGLTAFAYVSPGHYSSPPGDNNLVLSANTGETEFTLADDGSITTFAHTSGDSENVWRPAISTGVGGTNTSRYSYQVVGGVARPVQELAPVPAGVSCSSGLVRGCRALTFVYATATTAAGEAPGEWGEYAGRLSKVNFTAYEPVAKAMVTKAVAQYSYDTKGRLRAVWDPRVSPALKRTFGYDAEGHLTAVSAAGQEPWIFGYGSASLDASAGRLVTAGRPVATTALGNGVAPANTVAPSISVSQPIVGHSIQGYPGTWSNSPLRYGYQWLRCNVSGGECAVIGGAINSAYTPVTADVGHTLVLRVTAANGGGSTVASSLATAVCLSSGSEGSPSKGLETALPQSATSTAEYGVPVSGAGAPYAMSSSEVAKWGQTDVPVEGTAMFPPDEPQGWPASDYKRATIEYLDSADRVVNVAEPGGGIATSEYNSYNDVTRTLSADDREAALKEGSKSAEVSQTLDNQSTYGSEGTELLSTLGPLHSVKLASGASAAARKHTVYSYDEGAPAGGPYRLVTKVTSGAQIAGEPEADVRTTTKSYAGQNNLGWILRKPTATRTDPSGLKLTHTTVYDPVSGDVTETRTPAAGAPGEETLSSGYIYRSTFGSLGSGNGQVSKPHGIAIDKEGNVWVSDTENNRVEEFSSGGTFLQKFGTLGTGNGQLKSPAGITIDGEGNVWVVDSGNDRVEEFSKTGTYLSKFGTEGNIPTGAYFKSPMGIAYSPTLSGRLYVADTGNNLIRVFNLQGGFEHTLGVISGGSKAEDFEKPEGVAIDSSGNLWVADTDNSRVQEFTAGGGYIQQIGKTGQIVHNLYLPSGIAVDSSGNVLVTDGKGRVMTYTSAGVFEFQFGSEGTGTQNMKIPADLALDAVGDAYVADTGNNRMQKWSPAALVHESSGSGGTHGKQTIYYTAGENSLVAACGEHPEWGGLPCEKRPAAQPETSGVPNLPVTSVTYNLWDEPLVSTETVGASTRTTTNTYDEAGRGLTSTVTSTVGTALPTVKTEYNSETGFPIKTSTTVEGTTRTIERVFNRLGQRTSYKDADGNTSTAEYDIDGREISASDGKGTQTFTYDPTTGFETKLVDSAAGTFTGAYDAEGDLLTAGYPNGMNVKHAYDAAGDETGVEYVKTTHCTTGCVWYSETEAPSIHGQALSETSTLASESYTYDAAGRLTKAQDTPAGEGCTTRIYAYDEETNVQSLTTRPPGGEGKCATEGGTSANHSYDTANRLTDTGIAYDAFGDITKLPAADAGGSELTSAFYVDETLASQSQAGETIGYYLDPAGRTRQRVATGTTNSTTTLHYSGEGRAPSWTEDTLGKWTRNIPGLEGGLAAVQSNGEAPVLQIEDLQGNIVGTASLSETATGLLSKSYSTEYGVPRTSSPAKYSWMGGEALATELPSGIVAMGARSYVPEIGRFLQPDPIEGGSANEYTYTYGDPVNTSDPSGEFTVATPDWVNGFLSEQAEIATEAAIQAAIQRAAEERAAREEAEAAAQEAYIASIEVRASGGRSGARGGHGGSGRVSGVVLLSCNQIFCERGPIKIHCDSACWRKRNREEERRKENEKRQKEIGEEIRHKLECGETVESSYYGGSRVWDTIEGSAKEGKRAMVVCDGVEAPDDPGGDLD
jgi:RHS repeat-associated protein